MKTIKINIILLLIWIFSANIFAQPTERTTNGTILIKAKLADSLLIARSDQVHILMNYETAEFRLFFDISTLKTGIDSLDKILATHSQERLEYEGTLGIDYIETAFHEPINFVVEGYIDCNPHNTLIKGKGRLVRMYGGIYSCLLDMNFHIKLQDLPFHISLVGLDDNIHVQIFQTLLKRPK